MRSPRSWLGQELRRTGVISPVVDRFTDTQLEQLRALVAAGLSAAIPGPDATFPEAQLEQLRAMIGSEIRSAISAPERPFTEAQLEQVRAAVLTAAEAAVASAATKVDVDTSFLDMYAATAPSAQLAVDIFTGEWSSELPVELGVISGQAELFTDSRMDQVIEWFGEAIAGARVLELGPLEGGHTYMLDRAGAEVLAIESNSRAFLKCLIVKELLDLQRSHFVRGDFAVYLRETAERFDMVLASGVLYHMVDPVELLTLMAKTSDHLVLWTHYYDRVLETSPMARQFQADPEPLQSGGVTYNLHPRDYLEALTWGGFCGGPETYARWMERDDILDCLGRLGYSDITVSHDHPNHPNGPAFMVMARR